MARQTIITLAKTNVRTAVNVLNRYSEVIDVTVPRTLAYRIPYGTPILLWLFTGEVFSGTGAPQVLALAQNLVNSPSLSDEQEAVVFDGGVLQTGYTVAHEPVNTITGTFAVGVNNVEVFYIWRSAAAADVVKFEASDANKEKFSPLMNRPLFSWHGSQQYSAKERQELRNDITLPEKSHLLISLRSDVLASFGPSGTGAISPAYLEFAVEESSMSKTDAKSFVTFTE